MLTNVNHSTILVVEDERAVARGLIYGLREEGFIVEWAETGKAALALTDQVDPSLIVLDLRLPDITGLDVCRRLRQAGKRQPILMLTARDAVAEADPVAPALNRLDQPVAPLAEANDSGVDHAHSFLSPRLAAIALGEDGHAAGPARFRHRRLKPGRSR